MDLDAIRTMSEMLYPELGGAYVAPEHKNTLLAYEMSCAGVGPTKIGRRFPGKENKQAERNRGARLLEKAANLGLANPLKRRRERLDYFRARKHEKEFGACEAVCRLLSALTDGEKRSLLERVDTELSQDDEGHEGSGRRVLRKPVGLEHMEDL